jgi:hypothetical protein
MLAFLSDKEIRDLNTMVVYYAKLRLDPHETS